VSCVQVCRSSKMVIQAAYGAQRSATSGQTSTHHHHSNDLHPSKPNLVHVPSRRLYIFATDVHMRPSGRRHD
jgi:hypothetical protein